MKLGIIIVTIFVILLNSLLGMVLALIVVQVLLSQEMKALQHAIFAIIHAPRPNICTGMALVCPLVLVPCQPVLKELLFANSAISLVVLLPSIFMTIQAVFQPAHRLLLPRQKALLQEATALSLVRVENTGVHGSWNV